MTSSPPLERTATRSPSTATTSASNLAPAFAAVATTIEDVVAVLDIARTRGLGVRVRSTGHGFNSQVPLGDDIVLRTLFTAPVAVDAATKTAVVPAGALWGDVVDAAAPFGLAALHGSAASVGVIGYLLEGGASFYGRKYGLASNLIRSITVVLGDGRIVTASADTNTDLFWALRGGGGGFGVVTSVTIDLIDVGSVATGAVFWPIAVAPAVLEAWEGWAPTALHEVSAALRVMSLPPRPGIQAHSPSRTRRAGWSITWTPSTAASASASSSAATRRKWSRSSSTRSEPFCSHGRMSSRCRASSNGSVRRRGPSDHGKQHES